MRKPRFSLRTLLICTALVALCFAASKVHRRRVQKQVDDFIVEGVAFTWHTDWRDELWCRPPQEASIRIGNLLEADETLKSIASNDLGHVDDLKERLKGFGVGKIDVVYMWHVRME